MISDFDIVIVHYKGHWQTTVKSIAKHSRDSSYMVTIIDNYGGIYHEDTSIVRWVWPYTNIGWVKAANAGLALSTAPHVVLMNDDTEVCTEGWLEKMREGFNLRGPRRTGWRIAAVGPRTNYTHNVQNLDAGPPRLAYSDQFLVDDSDPERLRTIVNLGPLSFFCVMFSREALVEVGYLDERFAQGYGADDDDWQHRAALKGYRMAVQPNVLVKHAASSSWGRGEDRAEAQARNQKLLKEKWNA